MSQPQYLAVYARTSTLDQKKKETILAQIEANQKGVHRYLRPNGGRYELFPRSPIKKEKDLRKVFFCDDGFNLEAIEEGTAIHELLELIKAGEIHAIYVDRADRLFRSKDRIVRAVVQNVLENHDVPVFDHAGEIPRGLVLEILSTMAAEDKKQTLRKLQNGKIAKMKRIGGPMNNRQPYGYRWMRKQERWEIVDEEAKVIRWAVFATSGKVTADMPETIRMLVDQHAEKPGVPDRDLVDALVELGINMKSYYLRAGMVEELTKNPHGKLHPKFIYALLREKKYVGGRETTLIPGEMVGRVRIVPKEKKVVIEMNYPPIVSETDWADMEEARRVRTKYYGKNTQHDYLVRGLVVCAHCDARMQSASSFSKRYVKRDRAEKKYPSYSYKCMNRRPNAPKPCDIKSNHKSHAVDEAVWQKVKSYILNPDLILENEKTVREDIRINNVIHRLEEDLKIANFEIAQIEAQEERMLDQLARETISDEQFRKFSQKAAEERRKFQKARQKVQVAIDSKRKLLRDINRIDVEEIRTRYANRLDNLTFAERRTITLRIVRQVVLSQDSVDFIDFYAPTKGSPKGELLSNRNNRSTK